ncbi:MAG: hypothetical protein Tsb0020_51980 [Haliangiales bacterium]
MPVRVRFRFNQRTGEIEEFLVDDQDQTLSEAEHDRIAAQIAGMIAVSPTLVPVDDVEAASIAQGEPLAEPAPREGEPREGEPLDEPARERGAERE